jgi:hypothetical protein
VLLHALARAPEQLTLTVALFAAADVLVLPYREATTSQNALLAFAHGVPVITTTAGALGDLVRDDVDGLLERRPARDLQHQVKAELDDLGVQAGHRERRDGQHPPSSAAPRSRRSAAASWPDPRAPASTGRRARRRPARLRERAARPAATGSPAGGSRGYPARR